MMHDFCFVAFLWQCLSAYSRCWAAPSCTATGFDEAVDQHYVGMLQAPGLHIMFGI